MQTEVLYGNGLRTSYTYDERSQLTGMETVLPGMSNPLFRGTYAYDANGGAVRGYIFVDDVPYNR